MRLLVLLALASPLFAQFGDLLRASWSHGSCTGTGAVRYTVSPMDPADVSTYLPLGLMVDAHVTPIDHVYFSPLDPSLGRDAYAVRAPADGAIVMIQRRTQFVGDPSIARGPTDEYRVVIEHSCTFWTYFDLITSLDPSIVEAMGGIPATQQSVPVRIPVAAGRAIGRIGGQTLDMGTVNAETALAGFVVPEHYAAEPWKVHTVDPLDYFEPAIRDALLERNPRTAEPRGGRIDYDVDGRLAGNWFQEGTNGYRGLVQSSYWSGHFSAAWHYLDPSRVTVSIGDWRERSRQFFVKGNGPDPALISAESGPVKYELIPVGVFLRDRSSREVVYRIDESQVQGTLLVEVLPERKLRLETFPGAAAQDVAGFTAAARLYER